MGYYINTNSKQEGIGASFNDKVKNLLSDGAETVDGSTFQENLVCVVDNGFFAAAAYCFDENEYMNFNTPSDSRPKRWLVYSHAKDLAC